MSGSIPVGSPVLVRKLVRKRHWGSSDQADDQRVAEVLANVFRVEEKPYSLYQVSSEDELDHVALAMNSGRDSLAEECFFTFFTPAELAAASIPLAKTAGQTPCHLANNLHFDADAAETQLQALIAAVIASQRDVVRRSRSQMKKVVEKATQDQCLVAVPASTECKADGCAPP